MVSRSLAGALIPLLLLTGCGGKAEEKAPTATQGPTFAGVQGGGQVSGGGGDPRVTGAPSPETSSSGTSSPQSTPSPTLPGEADPSFDPAKVLLPASSSWLAFSYNLEGKTSMTPDAPPVTLRWDLSQEKMTFEGLPTLREASAVRLQGAAFTADADALQEPSGPQTPVTPLEWSLYTILKHGGTASTQGGSLVLEDPTTQTRVSFVPFTPPAPGKDPASMAKKGGDQEGKESS